MIHEILSYGIDSNCFVIEDNVNILVDCGTGLNTNVRDFLRKREIEIDILINTHCHIDHIGGNRFFRDVKIYAHELDTPDIERGTSKTVAHMIYPNFSGFKVTKRLREGDLIETGSHTLKVLHTPGHTEGSLSLYDLQEEILFSGDTLFHIGIGRMDFPSGSEIDMKNSLQRLNELEIEKIYPGHGQLTTKESLEMVLRFYF